MGIVHSDISFIALRYKFLQEIILFVYHYSPFMRGALIFRHSINIIQIHYIVKILPYIKHWRYNYYINAEKWNGAKLFKHDVDKNQDFFLNETIYIHIVTGWLETKLDQRMAFPVENIKMSNRYLSKERGVILDRETVCMKCLQAPVSTIPVKYTCTYTYCISKYTHIHTLHIQIQMHIFTNIYA